MRTDPATVDLRSDTVTRPSLAMRQAMAEAEVGDDGFGDDPTAAELERVAADLLGKEEALFFPSGIMANQTAILLLARHGTEVLVERDAHILHYEDVAAAAWAGVQLRPFPSDAGVPAPEYVRAALRPAESHLPRCDLICLENTHNSAGGRVVPVEAMADVADVARAAGLRLHLDGARLPNASIAARRPMAEWARLADTVMISLSKGLGAPIGSILAGTAEMMEEARRIRRRLGGGMRQVGVIAAAGLFALRHNRDRLQQDHDRARQLADAVNEAPGLSAAIPDTNIVMIDLAPELGSPDDLVAEMAECGVLTTRFGPHRIRAVTHLDVDDDGLDHAVSVFHEVTSAKGR